MASLYSRFFRSASLSNVAGSEERRPASHVDGRAECADREVAVGDVHGAMNFRAGVDVHPDRSVLSRTITMTRTT